jgi:hypothetical protein
VVSGSGKVTGNGKRRAGNALLLAAIALHAQLEAPARMMLMLKLFFNASYVYMVDRLRWRFCGHDSEKSCHVHFESAQDHRLFDDACQLASDHCLCDDRGRRSGLFPREGLFVQQFWRNETDTHWAAGCCLQSALHRGRH